MSIEEDIVQLLENPARIEDPEARQLMLEAETHYIASLEAENDEIREYEEEMVLEKLDHYSHAQGLVKQSAQYDF
jgi:hypothetical protein